MEDRNQKKTDELHKSTQKTPQGEHGGIGKNDQDSPYRKENELGSPSDRGQGAGQHKRGSE